MKISLLNVVELFQCYNSYLVSRWLVSLYLFFKKSLYFLNILFAVTYLINIFSKFILFLITILTLQAGWSPALLYGIHSHASAMI